jgi:hypothetical protein
MPPALRAPSTPPSLGWRAKAGLTAISFVLALAAAEGLARAWHRGAFPYLNIFEADPRYGVRLQPRTRTRVRSRDGRLTDIETNSLGFRGPEWPTPDNHPGVQRILLLGDSQMFGYGAAYADALPAALERALGDDAVVLDAAVPTWGPAEYLLALRDIGPVYRPRSVLFVVNAANDWFETVPNTVRTTARDGWAERPGLPAPAWFPLRSWLMGRSHLCLAVRQLARYIGDPELPPVASVLTLEHDLPQLRRRTGGHRSRLTPALVAAVELCRTLGCRVVAAALPLDAQVDPSEWRKYRAAPRDLSATEALLGDFVADARDLGLTAVDLLPVLRRAEPGAFLSDDYHLSPRGHGAVALALADALAGQAIASRVGTQAASPPQSHRGRSGTLRGFQVKEIRR